MICLALILQQFQIRRDQFVHKIMENKLEKIVALAKRRGFIFPGSEIYGGISGIYDYGPLGVEFKNNVKQAWRKEMFRRQDNIFELDSSILMQRQVWEASGHTSAGFTDPLRECKKCHHRYRADHLAEEGIDKCPNCGGELMEARKFNLLVETHLGPVKDDSSLTYLRGETTQGIYVNYKNIKTSMSAEIPFGVGQIGKAFRNEIAPRDFLFRLRELEQMEVEYFVKPGEWEEAFLMWRENVHAFNDAVGIPRSAVHELEVPEEDRAHYSKRTIDFEFDFPFGRKELYGLAYRTDFDLSAHAKASGADLSYLEEESGPASPAGRRFVPHVVEPSFGLDRTILAVLCSAYAEEDVQGERRTYLKFNPAVAPVKVAVFPLLANKPEIVTKAREIYTALKREIPQIMWDGNGNIGKRYRRQDEIGTPYCITVDFETLDKGGVTVRDRDSMKQERIDISEIGHYLRNHLV